MSYLQVAVPLPLYDLFTYKSLSSIKTGCRVKVNFNGQHLVGVVITCSEENPTDYPEDKIKTIDQIIDLEPYLNETTIDLIKFTAQYQHSPIGMIVDLSQPILIRKGMEASRKPIFAYKLLDNSYKTKGGIQNKILDLLKNQIISLSEFKGLKLSSASLNALENKKVIEKFDLNECDLDPFKDLNFENKLSLNDEQQQALDQINATDQFKVFLIEGVTGSGKTEVYMQAIEKVLKRKQQVLVMIPEIGLTPQTIERFHKHFNVPIAAMHSSLSDRERLDNYLACRDGKIAILIGTRSSVFTPFKSLGMIVIDEEHDSSYKQQDTCRYNAKNIAIYKAKLANCPIILGSATPSLESFYNAKIGKYTLLQLHNRAFVNHGNVSKEIIDLRNARLNAGLSERLLNTMELELQKGNQVLIFLNRRGYSNRFICNNCGYVLKCIYCDSFLTYHKFKNNLNCHHCETSYAIPHTCPKCNASDFSISGNGTEQIEEFLINRFPQYPLVRIDRDTTTKQEQLNAYLEDIQNNKYRILIGTQILSKGHHFPNVTLVALVNVDQFLFSNDFRATEQLAQLYTQVAGRTGREEKDGKVVVQSFVPNNHILQTIIARGYENFVNYCLEERKYLNLPPYSFQALIRVASTDQMLMNQTAATIFNLLISLKGNLEISIDNPKPALMEKKQNKFHILIMIQSSTRKILGSFLNNVMRELNKLKLNTKVEYYIDIDPTEVLQ